MQFYALQDKATNKIVSYVSDDTAGFNAINLSNLNKLGPYASIQLAQQANEPIAVDPNIAKRQALMAKASAVWTLADVADAFKLILG